MMTLLCQQRDFPHAFAHDHNHSLYARIPILREAILTDLLKVHNSNRYYHVLADYPMYFVHASPFPSFSHSPPPKLLIHCRVFLGGWNRLLLIYLEIVVLFSLGKPFNPIVA
jgi:hypothetical protein